MACPPATGLPSSWMHKDKPPGIFDFAERSIRHLIGFWLIAGFVLSILVHGGLVLWRADRKQPEAPQTPEALEAKTDARRTPPASSPAGTSSVRY